MSQQSLVRWRVHWPHFEVAYTSLLWRWEFSSSFDFGWLNVRNDRFELLLSWQIRVVLLFVNCQEFYCLVDSVGWLSQTILLVWACLVFNHLLQVWLRSLFVSQIYAELPINVESSKMLSAHRVVHLSSKGVEVVMRSLVTDHLINWSLVLKQVKFLLVFKYEVIV